jgi:hypothetical protein
MSGFTAGSRTWKSKAEALKAIGGWLISKQPVYRVSDREELRFLMELIERHPEANKKIGCGIAGFEIRSNPVFQKQNTLYLIRTDGSETDFSFRMCVSGKRSSGWADFCSAARFAISDQIIVYKVARFLSIDKPRCWITNEELNSDQCHVDHIVPFDTLIRRFVTEFNVDIDSAIEESTDGDVIPRFADQKLKNQWQKFHRENAVLNLATPTANMKRGKND